MRTQLGAHKPVIAVAISLAWSVQVHAESANTAAVPETERLDEVTVTARRRAEDAQKTPVSLTVITGADVQNQTVQSFADLMLQAPGVLITRGSAADASTPLVSIRGQAQTTGALSVDPPVALYVDGVYSNTTDGALFNHYLDVDRVEILKGPQGTLYGRNSTAGAINVYSVLPDLSTSAAQLVVGGGNFSRHDESVVVNLPLAEHHAAVRIAAGFFDRDGFGNDLSNGDTIGDEHTRTVRGTLRLEPSDHLGAIFRVNWDHNRNNGFIDKAIYLQPNSAANLSAATELFGAPPTPQKLTDALAFYNARAYGTGFYDVYNAGPAAGEVDSVRADGTITVDVGDVTLKSITAQSVLRDDRFVHFGDAGLDLFSSLQHTAVHQFSEELQAIGAALGGRLHYTVGAFYYSMSGEDNSASTVFAALALPTNPNQTNAHVVARSPAEYAQGTLAVSNSVNLTGGVRWTSETKEVDPYSINPTGCQVPVAYRLAGRCLARIPTRDENLSYTVGPDWAISRSVMLYSKASRSFKSGGVNQRISANPLSVAFYRPEQAIDYETGIKSQWLEDRLRLNGAFYHTDYRDIQRTVTLCAPTCFTLTGNAARAAIDGGELELTVVPVRHLEFHATGGYLNARYRQYVDAGIDQSFQRFPNSPHWTYSMSSAYTLPTAVGALRSELDWSWRGAADLAPSDAPGTVAIVGGVPTAGAGTPDAYRIQHAFGLLNGRLALELPGISVAVYVKNLTNVDYLSQMNAFVNAGIGTVVAVPGEPRTFGIELRKRF